MKALKEALFSRKNIIKKNPHRLTEYDIIGNLKGFPMGVVVRMLEEQEFQGNKPDVEVFCKHSGKGKDSGGFDWDETENGHDFWAEVIRGHNFNLFFKEYPEYTRRDSI